MPYIITRDPLAKTVTTTNVLSNVPDKPNNYPKNDLFNTLTHYDKDLGYNVPYSKQ